MNADQIRTMLLEKATWINDSETVDQIILGDPKKPIDRIMVSWMSTLAAIKYAGEHGFDLLVTHEPTFWLHRNEEQGITGLPLPKQKAAEGKKSLVNTLDLTILRIHDYWDRYPQIGIPYAWASFLGFGNQPAQSDDEGYQFRYDIPACSAGQLTEKIATAMATLGVPYAELLGDPAKTVMHVGIGTGCFCSIPCFIELGCDISIVCDDGVRYWEDLAFAQDAGHPVIRVGHGISEEPGMATLTKHIKEVVPSLYVEHYPQQSGLCAYNVI